MALVGALVSAKARAVAGKPAVARRPRRDRQPDMLQQMQPILEIIFHTNYDFGHASRKIGIKWVDISEAGAVREPPVR